MTHDFISLMAKADEKYSASGQQGLYNNLDTQALAFLVEDATRQKFIEFFEREIWHAIGASQGGSLPVPLSGWRGPGVAPVVYASMPMEAATQSTAMAVEVVGFGLDCKADRCCLRD